MKQASNHRRFIWVNLLLLALLLAMLVLSILKGSVALPADEVWQVLNGTLTEGVTYDVLWNLRLPRVLIGVVIGLQFALAGLILQSVIRNPLADPSVIGVSSGAGLAVVVFLLLSDLVAGKFHSDFFSQAPLNWLPLAASFGGLAAAGLVLALSWRSRMEPAKLALYGVAVGAFFNALVIWVVVVWGAGRTETSLIWLAGSLYGRDFEHLWSLLPWTLSCLLLLILVIKPLSLLRFNDGLGQSLGLNIQRLRLVTILLAVALAASAVSVAGPVGFVGLVIPHLARLLCGSDMRYLIVTSLQSGAVLMLAADLVGRWVLSPVELPAGAITTLIGIPIFLILLQRSSWR